MRSADHLYAYAANNPYRFHDPLGLDPSSIAGGSPSSPRGPQVAGGTQPVDAGISTPVRTSRNVVFVGAGGEFISIDPTRDLEQQFRAEANRGTIAAGVSAAAAGCAFGGCQAASGAVGVATTRAGVLLQVQVAPRVTSAIGAATTGGQRAYIAGTDFLNNFSGGFAAGRSGAGFVPTVPSPAAKLGADLGVAAGAFDRTVGISRTAKSLLGILD